MDFGKETPVFHKQFVDLLVAIERAKRSGYFSNLNRGALMHDRDDLKPGKRVRLTSLGIDRCPRLKSHTGVIVATSKQSNLSAS